MFGALAISSVSAASAASFDNLVPTANYDHACQSSTAYGGYVCQTDNSSLSAYVESSISSSSQNIIESVLVLQYQPTDLTLSLPSTATYTGSPETDIVYQIRSDVPSGNQGYTWCDNSVGFYGCDQQYVAFQNNSVINDGLACHESGHAVGLTHGANASPTQSQTSPSLGCMARQVSSSATLGSNNISAINGFY